MDTLTKVKKALCPGMWATSLDRSNAYHHISMRQSARNFLCFQVGQVRYMYIVLRAQRVRPGGRKSKRDPHDHQQDPARRSVIRGSGVVIGISSVYGVDGLVGPFKSPP